MDDNLLFFPPNGPTFPGLETSNDHDGAMQQTSMYNYGMMDTLTGPPLQTGFNGTPSSSRTQAHDDMCMDHCSGVGVYNGAGNFNHRGASSSGIFRHNSMNTASSMSWLDTTDMPSQSYWQQDLDSCRGWAQARNNSVMIRPPSWQKNEASYPTPLDNDESTCCSSECSRPNKCSDTACENKPDACTDRNCPDRADTGLRLDDKAVANTLMSLNHNQQQALFHEHHSQIDASLGFALDHGFQLHPWTNPHIQSSPELVQFLGQHILNSHPDPSSSCGRQECPLEHTEFLSKCKFPAEGFGACGLYDQFGTSDTVSQSAQSHALCGAGPLSGPSFIEHFYDQHWQQFNFAPQSQNSGSISVSSPPFAAPNKTSSQSPPLPDYEIEIKQGSPETPSSSIESAALETAAQRHDSAIDVSIHSDCSDFQISNPRVCFWCDPVSKQKCGLQFTDTEALFKHVTEEHIRALNKAGDGGYLCCWHGCKRSEHKHPGFSQRSKIERHMQTHVKWKPFPCRVCGQGFSAKQALQQHELIHTGDKPLSCPDCGKKFRHQSALTMHSRTHSGEKPLKCNICGKRFSESSNLSKHKRTHELKGRFPCTSEGCGRHFHRQDQLRRHQKQHEPKDAILGKAGKAKSKTKNPAKTAAAGLIAKNSSIQGGLPPAPSSEAGALSVGYSSSTGGSFSDAKEEIDTDT